jgi:hypothetical protein
VLFRASLGDAWKMDKHGRSIKDSKQGQAEAPNRSRLDTFKRILARCDGDAALATFVTNEMHPLVEMVAQSR